MSRGDSQLERHYQVLMRLAKSKSWGGGDLEAFLGEITEAAADTMAIERVNVWLYDEGRTKICCLDHYGRSTGEHSSGVEIAAADYPLYFQALDEERIIAADDAHGDPRTREFSKGYLDVNGITSMLASPPCWMRRFTREAG
jgi:GAF domain-containing protein